jgi:putative Ca2+/H+ antiporter (TMEM165/GDT1 family)
MHPDTSLVALSFGSVAILTFYTVFIAELVGDKTIYTVTSLSLRCRTGVLFAAMALAFAGKMLGAVLLAELIVRINSRWTGAISAGAFFLSAVFIWFKEPPAVASVGPSHEGLWKSAVLCFASLFFTEWGDPGQFAAAALAASSHAFLATWTGGTCALLVKGLLALAIGLKLRDWIPQGTLRIVASASCGVMGCLSLFELVFS